MIVNYWQKESMPYSWYPKNITEDWCGTDQPSSKDPNWSFPITYNFNSQGFRTHDFDIALTQKVNVALGCSHTLGIGLPTEMTWPSQIEKQTSMPTLNLGLGGGSSDTVARILTNISGLFNLATVYILWPVKHRFEYYSNDGINAILPGNSELEYAWYMDEQNSLERFTKNKSIVHHLQKLYQFDLKEIHMGDPWPIPGDLARDRAHNGIKSNLNLANLFLTMHE
jgi:hypothetical protein